MTLSWVQIFRLGLVQMALGAIVVLTTSTLNRLMVVELALPATLPGLLVALHYGIQMTRPKWGFASDANNSTRAARSCRDDNLADDDLWHCRDRRRTPALLLRIVAIVVSGAIVLTCLAVWGVERKLAVVRAPDETPFWEGLREVWGETEARNFTLFVFLSMTAYFMQELILEPYAGLVFAFTPGQSTGLSGAQNGGVFLGMLAVGIIATGFRKGALRHWVMAGCMGSAAALAVISLTGCLLLPRSAR